MIHPGRGPQATQMNGLKRMAPPQRRKPAQTAHPANAAKTRRSSRHWGRVSPRFWKRESGRFNWPDAKKKPRARTPIPQSQRKNSRLNLPSQTTRSSPKPPERLPITRPGALLRKKAESASAPHSPSLWSCNPAGAPIFRRRLGTFRWNVMSKFPCWRCVALLNYIQLDIIKNAARAFPWRFAQMPARFLRRRAARCGLPIGQDTAWGTTPLTPQPIQLLAPRPHQPYIQRHPSRRVRRAAQARIVSPHHRRDAVEHAFLQLRAVHEAAAYLLHAAA